MTTDTLDTSLDYQLGWERIFGAQSARGSIYYLPTEAGATIIQYDPDLRISALLPPTTREIQIDYKGRKSIRYHSTPFLILSHVIYRRSLCEPELVFPKVTPEILSSIYHFPLCYCELCSQKGYRSIRTVNSFYLFGIDPSTEKEIMAQPYRINNVYEDARCCFTKKGNIWKEPHTLKQAHARFWMDYFSDEFQPPGTVNDYGIIMHQCNTKVHNYTYRHVEFQSNMTPCDCRCCSNTCTNCGCYCNIEEIFADSLANYKPKGKWENHTRIICGEQFVSFPRKAEAVFISTDANLLKTLPSEYHKKSKKFDDQFIIGLANSSGKQWDIDLGDVKFSLNTSQIKVID